MPAPVATVHTCSRGEATSADGRTWECSVCGRELPVYSSRLTDDEYRGRATGTTPAALQAETRLAAMVAELAGKVATAVLARSGKDAAYFAETGRLDWGNVGDMQRVLARLIDAARPLGIDGLPEEES